MTDDPTEGPTRAPTDPDSGLLPGEDVRAVDGAAIEDAVIGDAVLPGEGVPPRSATTRPATGPDPNPMGVVLRLPPGRNRAWPTTIAERSHPRHADPADRPTRGLHAADPDPGERDDWPWVQEWRAGGEPTPWATGLGLATFAALVVGVAVWVLAAGLSDRPAVAILVNLLVAAGLAPAIWLSRGLPVLRWIGAGAAAGIVIGWLAALLMLPLPPP